MSHVQHNKYESEYNCFANVPEIFIDKFNYPLIKCNGQRVLGPPTDIDLDYEPDYTCEVFIYKIPYYIFETTLIKIFKRFGTIYTMKIFFDHEQKNRGYAYVKYLAQKSAIRAVLSYKKMGFVVKLSEQNCILFVGNLSIDKIKPAMAIDRIDDCSENIKTITVHALSNYGRYSMTVEFFDHSDAARTRKHILLNKSVLFSNDMIANWITCAHPYTTPTIRYYRNKREDLFEVFVISETGCSSLEL